MCGSRIADHECGETYGAPRVQRKLQAEGLPVGTKRVARLMREDGLVARSPKRRRVSTTNSNHDEQRVIAEGGGGGGPSQETCKTYCWQISYDGGVIWYNYDEEQVCTYAA